MTGSSVTDPKKATNTPKAPAAPICAIASTLANWKLSRPTAVVSDVKKIGTPVTATASTAASLAVAPR